MWCGVTCSTMGTWFSQRVMGLLIVLNKTVQMTQLKMTKICSNIFTRRHEIRNFSIFCHFLGSAEHFIKIFYDMKIFTKIYRIRNQLISFIFGHWPCDKKFLWLQLLRSVDYYILSRTESRGYIDVGDGYWWRVQLVTTLRSWWQI